MKRYWTGESIGAAELAGRLAPLSPREREVLGHILDARGAKATARKMGIGVRSVERLRSRVFARLNVENAAQAMTKMALQGVYHCVDRIDHVSQALPTLSADDLAEVQRLADSPDLTETERRLVALLLAFVPAYDAFCTNEISELTPREKEVLRGILSGKRTKDIAAGLGISPRTVDVHRANILKKLGVSDSSHLVRCVLDRAMVAQARGG